MNSALNKSFSAETANFAIPEISNENLDSQYCRVLSANGIKFIQIKIKENLPWVNPVILHDGAISQRNNEFYIEFACKGKTGSCQNLGYLRGKKYGNGVIICDLIHSQSYLCQHLYLNDIESFPPLSPSKQLLNIESIQQENYPAHTSPVK